MKFAEYINEQDLNEGVWSWLKTMGRYWKYDQGYTKGYFPYLMKSSESKNPTPKDVYLMTEYDVPKDLVIIKHVRTGKETEFTLKSFQDAENWLDLGNERDKTANGWYRIQLLEAMEKSDIEITVNKGGKIKVKTKYATEGILEKTTTFKAQKKSAKNAFINWDWLSVLEDDGTKIEIYFYDIQKFK